TMDNLELAGPTLKQIKPGRLWLQVKAQDVDRLVGLRWGALPGYGAPAWDLHVAEWPSRPGAAEPARPVVQLWWNPSSKLAGNAGSISRDLLQKDKATIAAELKVESSPDNRGRDPSIFDVK